MSISSAVRTLLVAGLCGLAVSTAAAEEITLQNGQKMVGTIVGFENGMFRVETEFGFALIRRDRVRSISFALTAAKAVERSDESKTAPATKTAPPGSENPPPASSELGKPASTNPPVAAVPAATPPPVKPPPPPASRPLDEPLPPQIQEHMEGNTYVNDTFQFSMYKPPGWKIHEGAPKETGRAIVAIGPEDEQTLLFVDRQVWSGPPDLRRDAIEANLRHTYENYQTLSESAVQLDGHPAVWRDFKGLMEGAEWHGVSVRVAQGNTVFGIVGLTSAEMFQFQQALLNKIINSFRFRSAKPEVSATR